MQHVFEVLLTRVRELSARINAIYSVSPQVYIEFDVNKTSSEGECFTSCDIQEMYIKVILPYSYKPTLRNLLLVDAVVIHEYCHYIEAVNLTLKARKESIHLYDTDLYEKQKDEKRTWRQTKIVAQELGIWSQSFCNVIKKRLYYSSDLKC